MADRVEITQEELGLIVQALEDATVYRDARSLIHQGIVRRAERRGQQPITTDGAGEDHRARAKAYAALTLKLKPALKQSS